MDDNGVPRPDMIQNQADEVVDKFPDASLESLAADLVTDAMNHKETASTALALAVELRMRAAAGVRKWTR
jgi:hypothetical protein